MPVPFKFTSGRHALKRIHGIFCVYKPEGMNMATLFDTLKAKIVEEINALPNYDYETSKKSLELGSRKLTAGQTEQCSPDMLVADITEKSLTELDSRLPAQTQDSNLPAQAGSLAFFQQNQLTEDEIMNNRLVLGDRYEKEDWRLFTVTGLAKYSSGVVVLGSGTHKSKPRKWSTLYTQVYHLKGRLGWASDSYDIRGRIVERSTFNHVNRSLVEKVCATMEANHQRKMFEYSGVNPESQEAYELATQGLLRPSPDHKEPIIYSIKCVNFELPNFTLEIHVINEKCPYLSEVIHSVGLLMNTSAVCAGIRRIRSGLFGVEYSLLYQDWNLHSIKRNVDKCRRIQPPVVFRKKNKLSPTLGYLDKDNKVVFKNRKQNSQAPAKDNTESQEKDTQESLELQDPEEVKEKERIEKEVRMLLSAKLEETKMEEKDKKGKK